MRLSGSTRRCGTGRVGGWWGHDNERNAGARRRGSQTPPARRLRIARALPESLTRCRLLVARERDAGMGRVSDRRGRPTA